MIVSLVRRLSRVRIFLVLSTLGLVLFNPLSAQDSRKARGPIPLAEGLKAPVEVGLPANGLLPQPPKIAEKKSKNEIQNGVRSDPLRSVDADSLGILGVKDGGLPVSMWAGSNRVLVARILSLIPKYITSPAQRSLALRLLLAVAEAPRGVPLKPALLSLRVKALFDMGAYDSAMALLDISATTEWADDLMIIKAEILFSRHDYKNGCELVRSGGSNLKGLYWQQAQAYCLAVQGETEKSLLFSEMMAETENSINPLFSRGIDALSGGQPEKIKNLDSFGGLLSSILRLGKVPLPDSLPKKDLTAGVYAALSQVDNASLRLRTIAAEKAALFGALSPSDLATVYAEQKFDPGDKILKNASISVSDWNSRARALFLMAAREQDVPAERAKVIRRALILARENNDFDLTSIVMSNMISGLTPSPSLNWFAPWAARSLGLSGEFELAKKWIELLRNDLGLEKPETLWPLAIISGVKNKNLATEESLLKWQLERQKINPKGYLAEAKTLYSFLQSLQIVVPGSVWASVLGIGESQKNWVPLGDMRSVLESAASGGRLGETIASSIVLLGNLGTKPENRTSVEKVIESLVRVKQIDFARQIAFEAAIRAGL
jgi:hypothetical protein